MENHSIFCFFNPNQLSDIGQTAFRFAKDIAGYVKVKRKVRCRQKWVRRQRDSSQKIYIRYKEWVWMAESSPERMSRRMHPVVMYWKWVGKGGHRSVRPQRGVKPFTVRCESVRTRRSIGRLQTACLHFRAKPCRIL